MMALECQFHRKAQQNPEIGQVRSTVDSVSHSLSLFHILSFVAYDEYTILVI